MLEVHAARDMALELRGELVEDFLDGGRGEADRDAGVGLEDILIREQVEPGGLRDHVENLLGVRVLGVDGERRLREVELGLSLGHLRLGDEVDGRPGRALDLRADAAEDVEGLAR